MALKGCSTGQTVQDLRTFLVPLIDAIAKDDAFTLQWKKGGPWSRTGVLKGVFQGEKEVLRIHAKGENALERAFSRQKGASKAYKQG
jgi:hypothetical protein